MTNFRNRRYEMNWAGERKPIDDPEDLLYDPPMPRDDEEFRDSDICNHLDETLTDDMALRAYACRFEGAPSDDEELERWRGQLIALAYGAGYDEWDPDFLEYVD